MNNIDWSPFDKFSESTCYCRCGTIFRSHSKTIPDVKCTFKLITRKYCPNCKRNDDIFKASSDVEKFEL